MKPRHICLISDQLLPHVIAALHEQPERVHAIASQRMQPQAERLKRVLADHGIETDIESNLPDGGFEELTVFAEQFRDNLPAGPLVVNLTGGTKLMALAFALVFRDRPDTQGRYVDTPRQRLETIFPQASESRLRSVLDYQSYLTSQGFDVREIKSDHRGWQHRTRKRRDATFQLARNPRAAARIIGDTQANAAPDKPRGGLAAAFQEVLSDRRNQLAETLAEAGLLRIDNDQTTIVDKDAHYYLHGGWLEEYAWLVARDVGLGTAKCEVTGQWHRGAHKNELDLIAVHGNRLLVAECKTVKYIKKKKNKTSDTSAVDIYKLDSVASKLRGLYGETLFLTQFEISAGSKARAADMNITVLAGDQLSGLADHLRDWMKDKRA